MNGTEELTDTDLDRIKFSIQELLDLCAANEVEVPAHLRRALLGASVEDEADGSHVKKPRLLSISIQDNEVLKEYARIVDLLHSRLPSFYVRIRDGSYTVTNTIEEEHPRKKKKGEEENSQEPRRAKQKIKTVQSESPINKLIQFFVRCVRNKGDVRLRTEQTVIMEKVNLSFKPGKMYLVLGAPGSGKSTLLKMIANTLYKSKNHVVGGEVSINDVTPTKDIVWSNLVSYMDQIDRLHPYLTVYETCKFSWECRSGGTHRQPWYEEGPEIDAQVAKMDQEMQTVNAILKILGLTRVKDTFVGDQEKVRGVSGGEKKRVTVAEMLCVGCPILCCDEISTGLDAATTYDITKTFRSALKIKNNTFIVSLLQPPPETVSNFDELILLNEGKILYTGPVDEVLDYFTELGYSIPERMDVADWLQALPKKDGWRYLTEAQDGVSQNVLEKKHLTSDQFMETFYASEKGVALLKGLNEEVSTHGDFIRKLGAERFANPWHKSLKLLVGRELLLWWRDKYQIKSKIAQSLIMGIVIGTLFWQQTVATSLFGVMFQSLMYAIIGAMTLVVRQFPERSILYKHQDANFFPTWTYVVGRSVASIPVACIDGILFGTLIYWFVGLAFGDGASIGHYFMFMLLLFSASLTTGLAFSVYPAIVQTVSIAQACMALSAVIMVLFSGFTVQPDVIPVYYIWIYWMNYIAWLLRGVAVNQFDSGAFDEVVPGQGETEGELTLSRFGFTHNDEPFTFIWAGYGVLFAIGFAGAAVAVQNFLLGRVRFATGQTLVTDKGDDTVIETADEDLVEIPFKRVTLTFKDIQYTVKASTSDDKLTLLKRVDGVVAAGKMTALMGSSGAGKTTLMDVLARRKSSGEITGEVRLNGHLQEKNSFRRCAGYVEQFDTQSPQLTIRETIAFSAKLRLEASDPLVTAESTEKFINQTMAMLELTNVQDLQIGSDAEGGLSFEQRKRLSIAVELVANPSILFLDEPTSGLDARAASIVMRGMKRIALSGRAVCATIHQPSIAIFHDFDSLLLLKRGGEVVFYGELGADSSKLIDYLEWYDATPKIQPGENPATWMLTTIGAGSSESTKPPFDYAGNYAKSKLHAKCLAMIDEVNASATEESKVVFPSKYATSRKVQRFAVLTRAMKVYYRSPNYNVVRVIISICVALLFSSVYASQRVPENESDMNSRINSIFIAVVFLCVSSVNTVLNVFQTERNMYYRHHAANMYDSRGVLVAYTLAEIPFIFIASLAFMLCFYFIMGFRVEAEPFFFFWLFLGLGLATFTFMGQMCMSLMRDSETAQGVSGIFVSFTLLFSGILLRPSEIPSFWIFAYWLFPGHYLFEGIFTTQYNGDNTMITADAGSQFFLYLGCSSGDENCEGTAGQWVLANFTSYSRSHVPYCVGYLFGFLFLTRIISYWALQNLNYRSS